MKVYEGDSADEVWQKAARHFRSTQDYRPHAGRGGRVSELLHAAFVIRGPRQRWAVSRQPPLNPAFAIAEVVWIVRGRRDSYFLSHWNKRLPEFIGGGRYHHGAYGNRIRHHFGIDQLSRAYQALKRNPDSRQIELQIWDPRIDFPRTDGKPRSPNIPCNVCALLKVRDGRLEWTQILRSNDFFMGVPYNFVQFTCLQEFVAGWLGVELGKYVHYSDSLHIYEEDQDHVRGSLGVKVEHNSDSLALPKADAERVYRTLEDDIGRLTSPSLSRTELVRYAAGSRLPKGFRNMFLVVAAEAARKRQWGQLGDKLIEECSNPLLRQVWKRWKGRLVGSDIRARKARN